MIAFCYNTIKSHPQLGRINFAITWFTYNSLANVLQIKYLYTCNNNNNIWFIECNWCYYYCQYYYYYYISRATAAAKKTITRRRIYTIVPGISSDILLLILIMCIILYRNKRALEYLIKFTHGDCNVSTAPGNPMTSLSKTYSNSQFDLIN